MKRIFLIVLVFLAINKLLIAQTPLYVVNAVIGDESFLKIFGTSPGQSTNEVLRIQTHLLFVENKLRSETPEDLTKKQRKRRETVLNHLHKYLLRGIFPSNYDYPQERKPCFIDRDGKICAVGYLIEKTAGIEAAEKINSVHKYDYIMDMNEAMVTNWAKENGFTLEECALIQPTYGGIPTDKTLDVPIKASYGISSGLIGGSNIVINILNLSNNNGASSKTVSRMGLVAGTAQVVLGLANIRKSSIAYTLNGYSTRSSYNAQNNLSYINIAAGAATLFSSAFNLYLHKNKKDAVRNNVSLYSYPDMNQQLNMGVTLVRKL